MGDTKTKTDDDTDDKGTGGGGGGGGGVDKEAIREVVSDVLGGLLKTGKADVHDTDDDDDEGGRRRGGRRSARGGVDVADISRQVEEAVTRVAERDKRTKAEQQTEDRIKALEERTAKPEKTPREFRKITRLMWGDPDAD